MTDKDRMLALLRERGPQGAHTSELRARGYSGNPSQRRIELLDEGYSIDSIRESFIGADGSKRPGARFILTAEPDDADLDGGAGPPTSHPTQASPPGSESAVEVSAGLFALPEPEADYRDPDAWGDAAA